jgi:dTDP-4-amino-4,6-dideoxygalactose transaminase
VWHVYCVRVLNGLREELIQYLNGAKVGTNIHYPEPLHLQNCYQDLEYKLGDFPITESYSKEILSLPLSWYHTEEEISRVSKLIKEFFRR